MVGAGRLQSPPVAEEPQAESDPVPARVVTSQHRPVPTFEPVWDWVDYCWDLQDE